MSTSVESSKSASQAAPSASDEVCISVQQFYVDGEPVVAENLDEAAIHELLGISA